MENEYKFITMHNINFLVMKTGLIARKLKGGR